MADMTDQAQADDFEVEPPGDASAEAEESHDLEDTEAGTLDDYYAEVERAESAEHQEESEGSEEESDEEAAEEESEGEEQEESEAEEAEEEEQEEEESEDAGDEPQQKAPERFRFKSDEDRAVAALAKAKGISLVEAGRLYSELNGAAPAEAEAQAEATPERTVAKAKEELKELRQKRADALRNVELDEAADLDLKIDALVDEIDDLRVAEADRDQRAEQQFHSAVEQSKSMAVTYYPDVTDANSPLVQEMQDIDKRLKATGNPLFHDPDKPFKLAQMAANTLGIAPANPKGKAAAKQPVKKNGTKVRRPVHQPAAGSARSAQPAAPASKVDERIDGITSLDDYEDFVGQD